MSKKEQIKKFLEEHKQEIKRIAILTGGAVCLGGVAYFLGREQVLRKLSSNPVIRNTVVANNSCDSILWDVNTTDGLGKLSDIGTIVNKGLEAVPEDHLNDTVVGCMVYVKNNVES